MLSPEIHIYASVNHRHFALPTPGAARNILHAPTRDRLLALAQTEMNRGADRSWAPAAGRGTVQRKIVPDVVRDQQLVHLVASATVRAAAKLMHLHNVGFVLVMEKGRLEGILTERDVVQRVVSAGRQPDETTLEEVMTRNPDTIRPEATAMDALRLMHDGGYRHLPVVDKGQVLGVVSRRDFLGAEKARMDEETAIWDRIG